MVRPKAAASAALRGIPLPAAETVDIDEKTTEHTELHRHRCAAFHQVTVCTRQ
jgi:hypothetical protein